MNRREVMGFRTFCCFQNLGTGVSFSNPDLAICIAWLKLFEFCMPWLNKDDNDV